MQPVSIIVPTYNQARYLPTCIDSIWFQDHPDIQIVVVNDTSTDDTAQVLAAYEQAVATEEASFASNYDEATGTVQRTTHPRYPAAGRTLTIVHHEQNRGLSTALNTGLSHCTGEFVTFIASDDVLLPAMARRLAQPLESGEADFAYADMHIIDDDGRILRRFALPDYTFEDAFCRWYLCGVCKLYRRDLHDSHGLYSLEHMAQDHEMFLRFAMGGARFVRVPEVLAHVRIHAGERLRDNHSAAGESRQFADSRALVHKARQHAGTQASRGA